MTPIERVRDALAGADKARAQAKRFGRMKDILTGFGFPKRATLSRRRIWAWRNLMGHPIEASYELDQEEIDMLSSYFYERQQAELRRAQAYEERALVEAGKEIVEPMKPWPKSTNPNRISATLSDVMTDPIEDVAREFR